MQEFVKPPFFYNEGAMHFGRGKFILPVFGPGAAKEATAKTKKIMIIAACIFVAVFLIVATMLGYQKMADMPLRQELLKSIGKPIADVAAQLEVSQEEMTQIEPGLYRIPAGCKYAGVTFDILFQFEENEGLLRSFGYEASYKADATQSAKNIAAIAKVLSVEEMNLSNETVLETSEKQLKKYFTDVGAITTDQTLDPNPGYHVVSDYIDHLESADYYEGRIGEYLVKNAIYYEDLHIAYEPDTEAVAIKLWCAIDADRTKNYS